MLPLARCAEDKIMKFFLAPHHDDILLSFPALICSLCESQANDEDAIHVLVLYSKESSKIESLCRKIHSAYNISVHELGLEESLLRGETLRSCIRRQRTLKDLDEAQVKLAFNICREYLKDFPITELVVPGTLVHIDHALANAAARLLYKNRQIDDISFYADQPYASLWPDAMKTESFIKRPSSGNSSLTVINDFLRQLIPLVSANDVHRIIKSYGHQTRASAEPTWHFGSGNARGKSKFES